MSTTAASRTRVYLGLGRVSNLPTVWTNTLAGVVLARSEAGPAEVALLACSLSLFYVGGMFLNDAFDREIDAVERPERPIPSGRVTAAEVFVAGFGMMGVGWAGLLATAAWTGASLVSAGSAGAALFGFIVLYDAWHKKNAFAPVVMGLCRAAVYTAAALASGGIAGSAVLLGAAVLAAYVVGLTFVARQENRKSYRAGFTLGLVFAPVILPVMLRTTAPVPWLATACLVGWAGAALIPLFRPNPNVPRSVVRLIAGIALVDGVAVATHGHPALWPICAAGFAATLGLQRWVRGT